MTESTMLTLAQIGAGGLIGAYLAHLNHRYATSQAYVTYRVNAYPLLNNRPGHDHRASIAVEESALLSEEELANAPLVVHSAINNYISVKNVSRKTAENFELSLEFEDQYRIVDVTSFPVASDIFPLSVSSDQGSRCRAKVAVPFLNAGDELKLTVIAAGSNEPSLCKVSGVGKGVKIKERSNVLAGLYLLLSVAVVIAGGAFFGRENGLVIEHFPGLIDFLGGSVTSETKEIKSIAWPSIVKWAGVLGSFAAAGMIFRRGTRYF